MSLLNSGYWDTQYWLRRYWDPDYWCKYGQITIGKYGYWSTGHIPNNYWNARYWSFYGQTILDEYGYWSLGYIPNKYWDTHYWTILTDIFMTLPIKVFMFKDGGTPKTGLLPSVDVWVKASDGSIGTTPVPSIIENTQWSL